MKFLVISVLLVGVCLAKPQRKPQQYQEAPESSSYDDRDQQQYQAAPKIQAHQPEQRTRESTTYIPIIRFDKEQGNDGSYKAAWETGNNIISEEQGYLKDLGPDPDNAGETLNAQVQQGSYSYTSPEGQLITVNYVADETGFHATGDHLPTPPPVSPEVQKGLDLIYAGIKAQEENAAREAQNPSSARKEVPQDFNGQYRQQ